MEFLGEVFERSILPALNSAVHSRTPFPVPVPELEEINVVISHFHNRPRDPRTWTLTFVNDRRKRVLCMFEPGAAAQYCRRFGQRLTEETGLVVKLRGVELGLISGKFVDSIPQFLPVQWSKNDWRVRDARMVLIISGPVLKVAQGATFEPLFIPQLSIVLDTPPPPPKEPEKLLYPPNPKAKDRIEFQDDYYSQPVAHYDLEMLAVPSKGSMAVCESMHDEDMESEESFQCGQREPERVNAYESADDTDDMDETGDMIHVDVDPNEDEDEDGNVNGTHDPLGQIDMDKFMKISREWDILMPAGHTR